MSKFFKMIPGYNNYLVSENGEIYSIKSKKYIKPRKDRFGYMHVVLCTNGKPKNFNVHRLVALTFIQNPLNLPQVNHIDGDKLNNNVDNLEWCDSKQNNQHAWKLGLKENTRAAARQNCKNVGKIYGKIYGKINGKINIKYAQKARIKHLDENLKELFDDIFIFKLKIKDICNKYNLSQPYISMIKNKQFLKTALKEYERSNLFQA